MEIKILAFSSSRVGNGCYLEAAAPVINEYLGNSPLNIAFIPFASVTPDYEMYTNMVRKGLSALPYTIHTVTPENAKQTIANADVIMVGGGNTFKLLHDLYALQLIELIQQKINNGIPYIGWSAGSNIAGATICTSNDMPIINPGSFNALNFLPFQINPHYYNQPVSGFNGETRDQRLTEFLQLNPDKTVIALPEGTALLLQQNRLQLIGDKALQMCWQHNTFTVKELSAGDDLSYLI